MIEGGGGLFFEDASCDEWKSPVYLQNPLLDTSHMVRGGENIGEKSKKVVFRTLSKPKSTFVSRKTAGIALIVVALFGTGFAAAGGTSFVTSMAHINGNITVVGPLNSWVEYTTGTFTVGSTQFSATPTVSNDVHNPTALPSSGTGYLLPPTQDGTSYINLGDPLIYIIFNITGTTYVVNGVSYSLPSYHYLGGAMVQTNINFVYTSSGGTSTAFQTSFDVVLPMSQPTLNQSYVFWFDPVPVFGSSFTLNSITTTSTVYTAGVANSGQLGP